VIRKGHERTDRTAPVVRLLVPSRRRSRNVVGWLRGPLRPANPHVRPAQTGCAADGFATARIKKGRAPAAPGRVVAKVAWLWPDSGGGLVMTGRPGWRERSPTTPIPRRSSSARKQPSHDGRQPARHREDPRPNAGSCSSERSELLTGWPITVFSRSGAVRFGSLKVSHDLLPGHEATLRDEGWQLLDRRALPKGSGRAGSALPTPP